MKKQDRRKPSGRRGQARDARPVNSGLLRADVISADGNITEALGYENFRVELDNGVTILATVSGKVRQNHIKLLAGDRVRVELSVYDLTRGRITYRHNK